MWPEIKVRGARGEMAGGRLLASRGEELCVSTSPRCESCTRPCGHVHSPEMGTRERWPGPQLWRGRAAEEDALGGFPQEQHRLVLGDFHPLNPH